MKTENEIEEAIKNAQVEISMAAERVSDEEIYMEKLGAKIEVLKWTLLETEFIPMPKKIKVTPAPRDNDDDEY